MGDGRSRCRNGKRRGDTNGHRWGKKKVGGERGPQVIVGCSTKRGRGKVGCQRWGEGWSLNQLRREKSGRALWEASIGESTKWGGGQPENYLRTGGGDLSEGMKGVMTERYKQCGRGRKIEQFIKLDL